MLSSKKVDVSLPLQPPAKTVDIGVEAEIPEAGRDALMAAGLMRPRRRLKWNRLAVSDLGLRASKPKMLVLLPSELILDQFRLPLLLLVHPLPLV